MKLAWLTDVHFDFVPPPRIESFLASVAAAEPDAILLGGDIGEANSVVGFLVQMAERLTMPIYFVLGNHDYYKGKIAEVEKAVRRACFLYDNLIWLEDSPVIALSDRVALVGAGGWGDMRLGSLEKPIRLSDDYLIDDLSNLSPGQHRALLRRMADTAAERLNEKLTPALDQFEHFYMLTHVPPFQAACWYEGRISANEWVPRFTCQAIGAVLEGALSARPDRSMQVLCGHTHHEGVAQILPNLEVLTAKAVYHHPQIQRLLDID